MTELEASGLSFAVGQSYSVQYKGICKEARPSRLNFQRDEVKIQHVITLTQDCWS